MTILFMQIDANTDNQIDWNDFSTYMLMRADGRKTMKEKEETQLFEQAVIPHIAANPHKEMIVRIQYLKHSNRYMTCSRDGTIAFWNEKLKFQRSFPFVGQANRSSKDQGKAFGATTSLRWVHDALHLEQFLKIAVASDDHQITLYGNLFNSDASTMEQTVVFDLQTSNPLSLDFYCSDPNGNTSMLIYGNDQGYVNIFYLCNDKLASHTRQQSQVEQVYLEKDPKSFKSWGTLWKRKAHSDWVLKVKYIPELKATVSVSPNPKDSIVVSLIDLSLKNNIAVSSIHKGANCVAFCKSPIALITGGSDHQIRLWNPHRMHAAVACLKGHTTPISEVAVNPIHGQIISLSLDKDIKIWDIRKHHCLQTFTHDALQRPDNIFSSLVFNPNGRGRIIVGSSTLSSYLLEARVTARDHPKSHELPIRGLLYNPVFKLIVSGCDEGVVNVWDPQTGQKTFTFSEAHGKAEITAMAFDTSGRRLITGARDGTIKTWNFNNGQLLQDLVKDDTTEVTGLQVIVF